MQKAKGEIIEYEGELFVIWCHKCWGPGNLIIHGDDVRTDCCNWLVGKLFDEDYKRALLEGETIQ